MALIDHPAILASFGYSAILTVVQIWAIISHRRRYRSMSSGISHQIELLKDALGDISARVDALESKSRLKKIA